MIKNIFIVINYRLNNNYLIDIIYKNYLIKKIYNWINDIILINKNNGNLWKLK